VYRKKGKEGGKYIYLSLPREKTFSRRKWPPQPKKKALLLFLERGGQPQLPLYLEGEGDLFVSIRSGGRVFLERLLQGGNLFNQEDFLLPQGQDRGYAFRAGEDFSFSKKGGS